MHHAVNVRPARIEDASQMARVHVESWRQTYRGLMPDEVLNDPGLLSMRTRFWTEALTNQRYAHNRVAVAERNGSVIGIAMSGPPQREGDWDHELFVLYVDAKDHGSGAGQLLLDAVLNAQESAVLWVADPNPRAQAFYRKAGFTPDGTTRTDDGVRAVRMIRLPWPNTPATSPARNVGREK
ncbi:MAG: GNAT family N-acetyltransferase [Gordonia sp. (in: high G+C Gram-positive bacteria)]